MMSIFDFIIGSFPTLPYCSKNSVSFKVLFQQTTTYLDYLLSLPRLLV